MNKKTTILLFVLLTSSLLLSACGTGSPLAPAATPTPAITPITTSAGTLAEASVVPVQSANLNFSTSGTVEVILKAEGTSVKKGDVIARLQGQERLEASLSAAKLAVASAQQNLNKLKENGKTNKASAELRVANASKALKDAKKNLDYADYKRGTRDQINEAQARYIIAQDAYKTANDNYSELAAIEDDNLTKAYALTVLSAARHNRDRALSDLNYVKNKPDTYDYAIVKSKLEVAQADYDQAKAALDKLNPDGINPDDLAVAEANLANANAQVSAAQSALEDLTLKAPFDGTIITNTLKVSETVGAASQQAQVVLANPSEWQIETSDLTELNINNIQEQSPVKVTFDAIPNLELTGKVLRIQSLGTNKQGDITYKVTISLDQQDSRLRWNMTSLVSFPTK
jgi:multidrug efflux pump subunit AcrA (membrane-fusion protein)